MLSRSHVNRLIRREAHWPRTASLKILGFSAVSQHRVKYRPISPSDVEASFRDPQSSHLGGTQVRASCIIERPHKSIILFLHLSFGLPCPQNELPDRLRPRTSQHLNSSRRRRILPWRIEFRRDCPRPALGLDLRCHRPRSRQEASPRTHRHRPSRKMRRDPRGRPRWSF